MSSFKSYFLSDTSSSGKPHTQNVNSKSQIKLKKAIRKVKRPNNAEKHKDPLQNPGEKEKISHPKLNIKKGIRFYNS